MKQRLLLFIAALILAGCETDKPQATIDLAPLSTQIGNLSDANADLRAANERLLAANGALKVENERLKAMLRADADAGLAANAKGWLPFEGAVWRHQLALLPGIQPDAATEGKWTEASGLYAAGGEAAMQGVIDGLNADAAKTNAELGKLKTATDQAISDRDAAQEAAKKAQEAVDAAKQELANAVAQARHDEARLLREAAKAEQVTFWNRCGSGLGLLALALAAGAFFSPVAKTKLGEGAAIAGGLAVLCFGMSRFSASAWFGPTVGIALAVGGGAFLFWKLRAAHRAAETSAKAEKYQAFGEQIVPILDDAYDAATDEEKAILDSKIFDKMSENETAEVKALVDQIRAAIKLEKSTELK